MSATKKGICSICNKPVPANSAALPFCSERCRLNDLANWLGEHYVVPGAVEEDSEARERKPLDEDADPSGQLH